MNEMMNKMRLLPVLLVPSCVLLLPAAAMLFKLEGWAWDAADFVVAWVCIGAAVAAYEFARSKAPDGIYRVAAGLAIVAALLLVWVNGAVGLIGSEDNPANLLYRGVLGVAVVGTAIAGLRPGGMAWAMAFTALAQFLVPVAAVIIWRPDFSPGVVQVFGLNFGFVVLFAASALLFRRAAVGRRPADTG